MGQGDAADRLIRIAARAAKPIYRASSQPVEAAWVTGRRLLAFSGIGHPERFHDSLKALGGEIVEARNFPDHHVYSRDQIGQLDQAAARQGLGLVTTEKDAARLTATVLPQGFMERLLVLKIAARFEDPDIPLRIIRQTAANFQRRRFALRSG